MPHPSLQSILDDRVRDLEIRLAVLESQDTQLQTSTNRRWGLFLAVVATTGSLVVGLVLWAIQFASTTKADSVKQSQQRAERVVASAQPSTSETYQAGATAGANLALAKFKQDLLDKDLVLVPRSTIRAKPKPQ